MFGLEMYRNLKAISTNAATCFFIIVMLFAFKTLSSQEELKEKNNLVFFELFGVVYGGAGIGYECYFQMNRLFRYSLRCGLSYDPEYKHVPLFFGNSLLFGKRHNAEMGFNYMRKYPENIGVFPKEFNSSKEVSPDNSPYDEIVQLRDIFNFLLGYRYQNERSGFMFRMFIGTPIVRNKSFVVGPHVGVSLGISF